MPLPPLPEVNRTKFDMWDKMIRSTVENYVAEQLSNKKMAAKLASQVPANMVQKLLLINEQMVNVLVENHGLRNVAEMQALVNQTAPILLPPTLPAYEGIWKIRDIITDWKTLPVTGHLTLGTVNAYASYRHGVLTLRSFLIGNFTESCFHASVAAWNGYRSVHQFVNIAKPLDATDVMLETASLALTSNFMKVKDFFTKGRQLKYGAEAALLFIPTLEWSPSGAEGPEALKEIKSHPSVDANICVDSEYIEIWLNVLMIEFD